MKKYLDVKITSHSGKVWDNPLKLSEGHLIPPLAANNRHLTVRCVEITESEYKLIFGGK